MKKGSDRRRPEGVGLVPGPKGGGGGGDPRRARDSRGLAPCVACGATAIHGFVAVVLRPPPPPTSDPDAAEPKERRPGGTLPPSPPPPAPPPPFVPVLIHRPTEQVCLCVRVIAGRLL